MKSKIDEEIVRKELEKLKDFLRDIGIQFKTNNGLIAIEGEIKSADFEWKEVNLENDIEKSIRMWKHGKSIEIIAKNGLEQSAIILYYDFSIRYKEKKLILDY
jgi:hypothetical protein